MWLIIDPENNAVIDTDANRAYKRYCEDYGGFDFEDLKFYDLTTIKEILMKTIVVPE